MKKFIYNSYDYYKTHRISMKLKRDVYLIYDFNNQLEIISFMEDFVLGKDEVWRFSENEFSCFTYAEVSEG